MVQAEGTVTAGQLLCWPGTRIRSKGFISPIITLNQNLSKQSLAFFVTLWNEIGQQGNLSLSISSSGRFVIKLTTESWPTAIDVYGEYFNMRCHMERNT